MRILITGANRGIGLELARQYLRRGDTVFATCRDPGGAAGLNALASSAPGRLTITWLDVDDASSLRPAYEAIQAATSGLDVLINNAGVYPSGERPGRLDAGVMARTFATNAIGPIMVAQQFLDVLERGDRPRIVNMTSRMGSLALKKSGRDYSYCGSKAALNMMTKALAHDLKPRGIVAMVLHPGWLRTDMGGSGAPLSVEESAQGILRVIDGLTLEDAARFMQWDGADLPW
jgi:NAD(P)-dependent dehydrogenase (short-subunit alcohol dehydrogenase family)